MKQIFLLHTRTLIVMLIAVNPAVVMADVEQIERAEQNRSESGTVAHQVIQKLLEDGLEISSAREKTSNLFHGDPVLNTAKLRHLQMHPALQIDDHALTAVLAKRALFGHSVDLDSYSVLTGIVQSVKGPLLSHEERKAIEAVATLNAALL